MGKLLSWIPQRSEAHELLDDSGADQSAVAASLAEVWQVNARLGGLRLLRRHLPRLLSDDGPWRLLEVGCGDGRVARYLEQWGRRRGGAEVVATDLHPAMVALARKTCQNCPAVQVQQADGTALPYPDASFDAAVCTLTLHHLPEPGAVRLLQELARVSRRGFVLGDLRRCWPGYAGARLLALGVWRSPLTRHDGPLSVLRSYTVAEVRTLLQRAGVSGRVFAAPVLRLGVVGAGHGA